MEGLARFIKRASAEALSCFTDELGSPTAPFPFLWHETPRQTGRVQAKVLAFEIWPLRLVVRHAHPRVDT